MRTRSRVLAIVSFLFLLPLLFGTASYAASLQLTGDIFALTNACCAGSSIDSFNHETTSFVSDTASGVAAGPGASGAADISTAEIDYGVFRGTASASMTALDASTFYIDARVRGMSVDTITIAPIAPALVGTVGMMNYSVQVTGSMVVSGTTNAQAQWGMTLATELSEPTNLGGVIFVGGTNGDLPPQTYNLALPVYLGLPTLMDMRFDVWASVQHQPPVPGGSSSAFADFGNTFQWLGITSVLDAEGNQIEYSLTSESGTDWTQAAVVPLPGAGLLFATGLAPLLRLMKRKVGSTK